MVIVILLVLGLCLGSFINAYIWRLHGQELLREQIEELEYDAVQLEAGQSASTAGSPSTLRASRKRTAARIAKHREAIRELSIWHGRSRCPHCGHELATLDLIPVVSYLALRRRCRYCGQPIDDTPLAELLTPALFLLSYLAWPHLLHGAAHIAVFAIWLVCVMGFVALTLYDLRWRILPNRIVLPLIGLAVVMVTVQAVASIDGGGTGDGAAAGAFWGVIAVAGIFRLLYELSSFLQAAGKIAGAWIGFGDVRLGVLLGLLVGGPAGGLLLMFVASLLGTLVSLPLLISGRATRTSHIPYGPFLMAAAIIVKFWGAGLIAWYSGLVL